MTIGEKIRAARKKSNMTQQELANITGMSMNTVSRYETGERTPSYDALIAIAKALNISSYDIFESLYDSTMIHDKIEMSIDYPMLKYDDISPEIIIIDYFRKLNSNGKKVALQRVQELTEIERYTAPEDPEQAKSTGEN